MAVYARIADGVVAELITVEGDPPVEERFPQVILDTLVEIPEDRVETVREGWTYSASGFEPPPPPPPTPEPPAPTKEELLQRIIALETMVATLREQIESLSET